MKLKGCIWNILHIIIYFLLCILINVRNDILKHIIVFLIGFMWLILAPYSNYKNKPQKCKNTVYNDTNIPRKDDLVFNTLGQLLYIIVFKYY